MCSIECTISNNRQRPKLYETKFSTVWSSLFGTGEASDFKFKVQSLNMHWLSVRKRVEFKLAVLVFKALNDLAPQYLSDD